MHPIVSVSVAEARQQDLRRRAEQARRVARARAVGPRRQRAADLRIAVGSRLVLAGLRLLPCDARQAVRRLV